MFKKKPQIKNLSPLRSSDRRKLADQIIAEYNVHVPASQGIDNCAVESQPTTNQSTPALSSIRLSLVPESCLSAKFTTHAGANATLVSGTVYVGAYPGQEERILWIQYGKDSRLYPTVYTLWHNPGLCPLLHTQDFVVERLRSGADLMTPGLVGGPPWPEAAKAGSVVAVAGLERPSVPVCVGVCKVDISSLGQVQGSKGAAVEGVHWEGDELWSWSQFGNGGRSAPENIEAWDMTSANVQGGIERLDLEDADADEDGQEDGGVALDASALASQNGGHNANGFSEGSNDEPSPEHEPSTTEIDSAFIQAFLYALHTAKKTGSAPSYGLDFPILPSLLISNMIQPHLRAQTQHYTVKKTTWKNVRKFIKHLEKAQLVKSKDRNGGETVILDVDFDDQRVVTFAPYDLPKPKAQPSPGTTADTQSVPNGIDSSLGQKLTLQTVYRASSKLVPDLIPSKTTYYTASQITAYLKKYIENNPDLTEKTSSSRFVKLDPFIANNILGSNSTASDARVLAAGEIARDTLNRRILQDTHLAIPHWLLLRDGQTYSPDSPSHDPPLKPKPGAPPIVTVILEKRSGTKVVTKISGLEAFGINPQILGPELQKKCAGSASVGQHVGGKPGMMEILVQGDQREVVQKEVGRRGVDRRWIVVDDKTRKKKK